jgi:TPR repeat protein
MRGKGAARGTLIVLFVLGLVVSACTNSYKEARRAVKRGDYATAYTLYLRLAEQGDHGAQSILGNLYAKGHGVARDFAEAVKWYRKAAAQGNRDAQNNLGNSYAEGHGVAKDFTEAVRWYRTAAARGSLDAQNNLGNSYAEGRGVARDFAEAVKWYRTAAAHGNSFAQANLARMYEGGLGIAKDDAVAMEWYRRAAARGHAPSQNNVERLELKFARKERERREAEAARRAAVARELAKLAEKLEQKRLAEELEQKRLAEELERKRLAEERERVRLAEERERLRRAEERERVRLAEEREQLRRAEERERKRLAQQRERARLENLNEIIWATHRGRTILKERTLEHESGVTAVAFSHDGRRILTGSEDGKARLWKAAAVRIMNTFEDESLFFASSISAVAFSPDDRWVLAGSGDGKARLWKAASGRAIDPFEHESDVTAVAFSPDGRWVLTGSDDGKARLWGVAARRVVKTFEHESSVTAVAFSPDGRLVLTGSEDGKAQLWDAAAVRIVKTFEHPSLLFASSISAVAFSPDGRFVLTGSADGKARLWDVAANRVVNTFEHGDDVNAVAFFPNGRFVLSGGDDGKARLWGAATGRRVGAFEHGDDVNAVTFSPDGGFVLTGSDDGTARLWNVFSDKRGFDLVAAIAAWRFEVAVAAHAGKPPPPPPPPGKISQKKYENTATFEKRVRKATAARRRAMRKYNQNTLRKYNERLNSFPRWRRNKIVEEAFFSVFGEPRIAKTYYDPDSQLFAVDVESDNKLAGGILLGLTLENAVPNAEAKTFDTALARAEPVMRFAFDEGRFSLAGAEIEVDGRVFAALPRKGNFVHTPRAEVELSAAPRSVEPVANVPEIAVEFRNNPKIAALQRRLEELRKQRAADAEIARMQAEIARLQDESVPDFEDELPALIEALPAVPSDGSKYLVAIGISDYDETVDVPFAARSAELMARVVSKRFGVPEGNTRLLLDSKASGTRMKGRLRTLLNRLRPGDTLYFYYAGHGLPARNGNAFYLLPSDGGPGSYEDRDFSVDKILAMLGKSRAGRVFAFIDACFSGRAGADSLVFEGVAGVTVVAHTVGGALLAGGKLTLFLAGGNDQFANQYKEKGNRLFSYHLIRGLAEGRTAAEDLHEYVADAVDRYSRGLGVTYTQTPILKGNRDAGLGR